MSRRPPFSTLLSEHYYAILVTKTGRRARYIAQGFDIKRISVCGQRVARLLSGRPRRQLRLERGRARVGSLQRALRGVRARRRRRRLLAGARRRARGFALQPRRQLALRGGRRADSAPGAPSGGRFRLRRTAPPAPRGARSEAGPGTRVGHDSQVQAPELRRRSDRRASRPLGRTACRLRQRQPGCACARAANPEKLGAPIRCAQLAAPRVFLITLPYLP